MTPVEYGEFPRTIEGRKEKAIETLTAQYSHDILPIDEFDRLVEYVHNVGSTREMAIIEKMIAENSIYSGEIPGAAPQPFARVSHIAPAPDYAASAAQADAASAACVFSARQTSGMAVRNGVRDFLTVFGNSTITIKDGDLTPGTQTEISVLSVFGLTVIIVPASVAVEIDAAPDFAGIFAPPADNPPAGAARLTIHGSAIFGNITVRRV